MEIIIYHGSDHIIYQPSLKGSNIRNDFGYGFYCTENIELAKEWACKKGEDGFANKYLLNMDNLTVCNLNSDQFHILNWLALLTRYRSYWQKKSIAEQAKDFMQKEYLVDLTGYDLVVGYRADDSYFSFAQDFVMGTISLQQLSVAMRLGKLGEQIVLKSQKSFDQLKYVDYTTCFADEYYTKKMVRDNQARMAYQETKNNISYADDIYMIDILRGRVKEDDLRIF